MKYLKISLLNLILLGSTPSLLQAENHAENNERPTVTIFVHGTKPQFVGNRLYQHAQYYFKPGLHHIDCTCRQHGPHDIRQGLQDSGYVDTKHLYLFGWSGKLSSKERERVAEQEFMPAVKQLMEHYKNKYNVTPYLCIIGHSHGTNVVLYLINALDKAHSDIIIEEAILLAGPVQEWTKDFVLSDRCKKVYHFFSTGDIIQRVDPQGIQVRIHKQKHHARKIPFYALSERTFPHNEKVVQIHTKINGKPATHLDFIDFLYAPVLRRTLRKRFTRFLPSLGSVMEKVKTCKGGAPISLEIKQSKDMYTASVEI